MDKGEGVANLYPSLLTEKVRNQINVIPCIIRHGKADSSTLLNMLPLPDITEIEMTNIINYIVCDLNNNSDKIITLEETKKFLSNCK